MSSYCLKLRVCSKRLLRSALRHIGKITVCVILLTLSRCLLAGCSPLGRRLKAVTCNNQLRATTLMKVIHSGDDSPLCHIKAPSVTLNFSELMESTGSEDWLSYYGANTRRLSRMSAMQIVCSYHCFCDDNCVAFVHIEQSTGMCNLIHSTQTRCFPQPECRSYSKVSLR